MDICNPWCNDAINFDPTHPSSKRHKTHHNSACYQSEKWSYTCAIQSENQALDFANTCDSY